MAVEQEENHGEKVDGSTVMMRVGDDGEKEGDEGEKHTWEAG